MPNGDAPSASPRSHRPERRCVASRSARRYLRLMQGDVGRRGGGGDRLEPSFAISANPEAAIGHDAGGAALHQSRPRMAPAEAAPRILRLSITRTAPGGSLDRDPLRMAQSRRPRLVRSRARKNAGEGSPTMRGWSRRPGRHPDELVAQAAQKGGAQGRDADGLPGCVSRCSMAWR